MTQRSNPQSANPDRLREHPAQRFAPSQHAFDLRQAVRELKAEDVAAPKGHRQRTLYRHGKATIAVFLFEKNAGLANHKAAGTVTIHVIDGKMRITTGGARGTGGAGGEEHVLTTGQLLVLAPGVEHELYALEESIMLLQVHLE